jgi:hypothetical protein
MKKIKLDEIIIDGGTQTRAALNETTIDDYAEAMTERTKFPAVVVFASGTAYLLADGFHRFMAAQRCGWVDIDCDVRKGSKQDAIRYSLTANNGHGLRRTNADKRRGVEIALREFGKMSNHAIAEMCGVSDQFVNELSKTPLPTVGSQPPPPRPTKRIGRDGRETETANIGKPPRDPGPPPMPPAQEKDPNGKVIPKKLLELWHRRLEIHEFCQQLSRMRITIEKGVEDKDKLYAELNIQSVKAALDQAYSAIKATAPYCVCPSCQGEGCRACGNRGLIGRFRYNVTIPEELK